MLAGRGIGARLAAGHAHLHPPHFRLDEAAGSPARARVIVIMACILGLQAADTGAVGALAAPLEKTFHIGNTQLGLLVAVTTLVGCVATLPFGGISDRYNRSVLLQIVVALWSVATLAGAVAPTYDVLLATRLALGAVVAAAGPALASLVGDLFPGPQRGRLWGYVLTGELIGAGVGILVAGGLSGFVSWRVAMGVLAVPAAVLAWGIRRWLPEPVRGGQDFLPLPDSHTLEGADARDRVVCVTGCEGGPTPGITAADDMNLWQATRYVLGIRTNVALIVASGLGYFFLSGLETFAELYFRDRYGVGQSMASILFIFIAAGSVFGVLMSGRISDDMISRGRTRARMVVGTVAYGVTALVFLAGVISPVLVIAVPVLFLAAVFAGASNPPTDAARLDILPSRLWGRAEAVRTFLRQLLQGSAPVVYGVVSGWFGAAHEGLGAGVNNSSLGASASTAHALELTFLVLTTPLLVAAAAMWLSRNVYLRDIAAARRSERSWRARPAGRAPAG